MVKCIITVIPMSFTFNWVSYRVTDNEITAKHVCAVVFYRRSTAGEGNSDSSQIRRRPAAPSADSVQSKFSLACATAIAQLELVWNTSPWQQLVCDVAGWTVWFKNKNSHPPSHPRLIKIKIKAPHPHDKCTQLRSCLFMMLNQNNFSGGVPFHLKNIKCCMRPIRSVHMATACFKSNVLLVLCHHVLVIMIMFSCCHFNICIFAVLLC